MLNYALTLEYLEAEFYRQGNSAGLLNGKEMQYLDLRADEDSHVATITATAKQLWAASRSRLPRSTSVTQSPAGRET